MTLPSTAARALSVRNPWAALIASGHKDVENRTWRTGYRGPLLICAATGYAAEAHPWIANQIDVTPEVRSILEEGKQLPKGVAVCVVDLVDVVEESTSPWAMPGHFHWVLANSRPISQFPVKGQLGLFTVQAGEQLLRAISEPLIR